MGIKTPLGPSSYHEAPFHSGDWMPGTHLRYQALFGLLLFTVLGFESSGRIDLSPLLNDPRRQFLLADLVFLNATHVIFTFLMIATIPEGQQRIEQLNKKLPWFIPVLILLLMVGGAIFTQEGVPSLSGRAVYLYFQTIPMFHVFGQTKGLTLSFVSSKKMKQILKLLWRLSISAYMVRIILREMQVSPTWQLASASIAWVGFGLIFLTTSLSALRRKEKAYVWQILFATRILLLPLAMVSVLAAIAISCLHGVEYLSVTLAQFQRNKKTISSATWSKIFGAFIAVNVLTWVTANQGISSAFSLGCVVIMNTISLAHYYVDAFIFRSKSYYSNSAFNPRSLIPTQIATDYEIRKAL